MSEVRPSMNERLLELLAMRAVDGLMPPDAAELERLMREHPDIDAGMLDDAAAVAWLALRGGSLEAPPESVVQRAIEAASSASATGASGPGLKLVGEGPAAPRHAPTPVLGRLGWLVAAAALALAAFAFFTRSPAPTVLPSPTVVQLRQQLIDAGASAIAMNLTKDPAAQTGSSADVVWDAAKREGFLKVSGLAVNTPTQSQYQIWVFDANRPQDQPVHAGVFDVDASGNAIVRINPSLSIGRAAVFAVSVEGPGGSVLPNLNRVVAITPS